MSRTPTRLFRTPGGGEPGHVGAVAVGVAVAVAVVTVARVVGMGEEVYRTFRRCLGTVAVEEEADAGIRHLEVAGAGAGGGAGAEAGLGETEGEGDSRAC